MRKIDKSTILSTAYKKWVEELESNMLSHKVYDSNASKFKFYQDIVMNLFHCQNGLCAYTEQQLCPEEMYERNNWTREGIFSKSKNDTKPYIGELDHFDESLKETKGWLWENLFMIDADTNNRKGTKTIDYILKPDERAYTPEELLEYSESTGRFEPHHSRSEEEKDRIQYMIRVLGINHHNVVDKRRREVGRLKDFPLMKPREFPTAVSMISR